MPSRLPPPVFSAYDHITPVIGHRGACGEAPENTQASIELAAHQGAQWVEVDVTISADGIAVIHHDHELDRCTDGTGILNLHRLSELKKLDAGSWFASEFAQQRILTLTELLTLANQLDLNLNLEVKPVIGRESETVWAISRSLQEVPFEHPLLLSSFSLHALRACASHLPHITRAINVEAIPRNWSERIEEAGCQGLHFQAEFASESVIREIKAAGYHLLSYTVNNPEVAEKLLGYGVDGVFTDHPARMIRALSRWTRDGRHH
jgi:glycerophosphoryl diester phosphodiesterase